MSSFVFRLAPGVLLAASTLLWPADALAGTISVTTFTDEFGTGGDCSLREAIRAANDDAAFGGCPAGSGADTIQLAAGTYTLAIGPAGDDLAASGDLDIRSDVSIHGAAAPGTAIDGGQLDRAFHVDPGNTGAGIILSDVAIRGGNASGDGGAIRSLGALELTNVTVSGNTSTADGGGLQAQADAVLVLTNVTVSGNSARGDGGGIVLFDTASGTLNNLTITGNVADTNTNGDEGGGIASLGGALSVRNTIVAGNTDMTPALDAPDCSGALSSAGHNLIGNGANCGIAAGPGDQIGTPAAPVGSLLGPLAANGGPTQTHALLPGSPAIDSGGTDCAAGDQRGAPRGDCDIGAYEVVRCLGRLVNQIGTEADDTLIGSPGPDGVLGLSGKDRLSGGAGADGLCGGSGRDTLKGGGGRDRLNGEDGKDLCIGGGGRDKAKKCERERTIP